MPVRRIKLFGPQRWRDVRGAGDVIEKLVHPIAKAMKSPCIDPETDRLKPSSPCGQRAAKMNNALPIK